MALFSSGMMSEICTWLNCMRLLITPGSEPKEGLIIGWRVEATVAMASATWLDRMVEATGGCDGLNQGLFLRAGVRRKEVERRQAVAREQGASGRPGLRRPRLCGGIARPALARVEPEDWPEVPAQRERDGNHLILSRRR